MLPELGLSLPGLNLCPHCARPVPASLLDAAFYLCGDPELRGHQKQFVRNMRELLLHGLTLAPAHHTRLLELYLNRHKVFADHCRYRRARIAGVAEDA
jgi:hypothetical protein